MVNPAKDAGVSELCWIDVELTCDVCSFVHYSYTESWWNVDGDSEAAVD